MKHIILSVLSLLAASTASAQMGVETLDFGVRINSMRVYDDTIFVATDQDVHYYNLNGTDGCKPYSCRTVVIYDLLKCGTQWLESYTKDKRFCQHPSHPERVYCSEPTDWQTMGYTLSKSADFGGTWWTTGRNDRLFPGRPSMAFNPLNDDEVLVYGVDEYVDCICPWMLSSTDRLETLKNVDFQTDEDRPMMQFMQLAFSPATDGEVLAATTCGLARSADHGRSWQFLKGDISRPGYVSPADELFVCVCFDAAKPAMVYALTDGRRKSNMDFTPYYIYRSADGGQSWQVIADINLPDSDQPTIGVCDLQCYKGMLLCRTDRQVYLIREPQRMVPLNNSPQNPSAIGREPQAENATPQTYDLLGRQGQHGAVIVADGRKYLAK